MEERKHINLREWYIQHQINNWNIFACDGVQQYNKRYNIILYVCCKFIIARFIR